MTFIRVTEDPRAQVAAAILVSPIYPHTPAFEIPQRLEIAARICSDLEAGDICFDNRRDALRAVADYVDQMLDEHEHEIESDGVELSPAAASMADAHYQVAQLRSALAMAEHHIARAQRALLDNPELCEELADALSHIRDVLHGTEQGAAA